MSINMEHCIQKLNQHLEILKSFYDLCDKERDLGLDVDEHRIEEKNAEFINKSFIPCLETIVEKTMEVLHTPISFSIDCLPDGSPLIKQNQNEKSAPSTSTEIENEIIDDEVEENQLPDIGEYEGLAVVYDDGSVERGTSSDVTRSVIVNAMFKVGLLPFLRASKWLTYGSEPWIRKDKHTNSFAMSEHVGYGYYVNLNVPDENKVFLLKTLMKNLEMRWTVLYKPSSSIVEGNYRVLRENKGAKLFVKIDDNTTLSSDECDVGAKAVSVAIDECGVGSFWISMSDFKVDDKPFVKMEPFEKNDDDYRSIGHGLYVKQNLDNESLAKCLNHLSSNLELNWLIWLE